MTRVLGRAAGTVMLAGLMTFAAKADDRPFAWSYSTDIETQGETEIEHETTWKSGHAQEAFQAIETRIELERGFTDDFQGSFYLTYDWERARAHPIAGPAETSSTPGISGEFIYRFSNVYFDPIGFALYVEPSFGNGTREFEVKALFQKNFLNDDLRLVLNVNLEDQWEKNSLGQYDEASALEFYTGVAYSLTPDWSIAAELANERGFNGLLMGGSASYSENAWYLGPTISYAGQPIKVVLGAQFQLPLANDPTHTPGAIANGYLAGAERFRLRLRLAKDI